MILRYTGDEYLSINGVGGTNIVPEREGETHDGGFSNKLFDNPEARDSGIIDDDLAILAQKEKAQSIQMHPMNNNRVESMFFLILTIKV